MIGRSLSNRYEIQGLLGEGGTAMVYLAMDQLLGRPVAVKVLRPEYSHDEKFVTRFRREARASAQLSHPNIVQVFDVGQDDGIDYIVMEYVDGYTLAEKIHDEGRLPVSEAVRITIQVLEALAHAHEQGVVHRDIKPQNILLTRNGKVKVTDFGIARAVGSTTLAGTQVIMGSAHYISPEQAKGGHTGAESDLYSLGVVLFEMLTGERPYEGETAVAVALKHLQEPIPEPKLLNPRIPEALNLILQKALAKQVHRRYATAEQFRDDLQNYDQVEPHQLIAAQPDIEDTLVLPPLSAGSTSEAVAIAVTPSENPIAVEPEKNNRKWRSWLLVMLLAMTIFGGAASAAYYVNDWLNPPLVEVPSVVGMPLDDVQAAVEPYDIEIRVVQRRHDEDYADGVIVWQDPEAGQLIRKGAAIDVIVSLGPEQVAGGVPDVVGYELREAQIELRQAGLEVEVEERYHSSVPRGRIIDQAPVAGEPITVGSSVKLIVSAGPHPDNIQLPNFIGRPLEEVRQELARLKLQLGEVTTQISDYPQNFVRAQNPVPGTFLQPGQKVNLTVSQGNGINPETTVITVRLPDQPAQQQVEIRVRDRSERIVYTGEHRAGSEVKATVHWYKPHAQVLVLVNGQLSTSKLLPETTGDESKPEEPEEEIDDQSNEDNDDDKRD